jgi:hypothetical protein
LLCEERIELALQDILSAERQCDYVLNEQAPAQLYHVMCVSTFLVDGKVDTLGHGINEINSSQPWGHGITMLTPQILSMYDISLTHE